MTTRRKKPQSQSPVLAVLTTIALACALILGVPLLGGTDLRTLIEDTIATIWQPEVAAVAPLNNTAEVHFIDVGQASSILVCSGDMTALIDAGEAGDAETVITYLKSQGITELDYFFATHPHSDHIGGARKVLQSIPAENVVMSHVPDKIIPTTATYQKLIGFLVDSKATTTTTVAEVGDSYILGGDLTLTVLAPTGEYNDLNDTSLVLRMDYGATSFLFTGDMEEASQQDVVAAGGLERVTVLSAPHHGSKSSLDSGFMRALRPQYAVISCGLDNDYGHPHRETLELYDSMNIVSYRTDKRGTIKMITDGATIVTETERS